MADSIKHLVVGGKEVFAYGAMRITLDPKTGEMSFNVGLRTISDTDIFASLLRRAAIAQKKIQQKEEEV